ncbi:MAG: ExbD/TolR family protein [Thermoanaerobaculia bacterium]
MKTNMNADINVTPLVDVCLVLLIIFMVCTPLLVNRGVVQLPQTIAPDDIADRALPITIKSDGVIYIDGTVIRSDEVSTTLDRMRAESSSRPIAVRADKRVSYGDVQRVLALCREAGWQEITLVGEKTYAPRT